MWSRAGRENTTRIIRENVQQLNRDHDIGTLKENWSSQWWLCWMSNWTVFVSVKLLFYVNKHSITVSHTQLGIAITFSSGIKKYYNAVVAVYLYNSYMFILTLFDVRYVVQKLQGYTPKWTRQHCYLQWTDYSYYVNSYIYYNKLFPLK